MVSRGRVRTEPGRKRVRGYVDGVVVFDTTSPLLVWEVPHYPAYYVPVREVTGGVLEPNGRTTRSPSRGDAHWFDLRVGTRRIEGAAWHHPGSPIDGLADHVRFEWDALDAWFEEDEQVWVHPRDPYTRVDVLRSSRQVRVELDGVVLAESTHPTVLFETGLPVRFYLPKTAVRMGLLTPTATASACPYKGWAEYWSVDTGSAVHADVAWSYRAPLAESAGIGGLVCFYNERVDLVVDGERLERPRTKFS